MTTDNKLSESRKAKIANKIFNLELFMSVSYIFVTINISKEIERLISEYLIN